MCFADGTVETPPESNAELRAEFRTVQLLTFTVILRCCSPVVQIALKSCRRHLDAGHQAWRFITATYQVTDDLYIGQLEEQMTHLRMGEQETATDYCNRARRILAYIRMADVEYSMASYVTHVIKGLPNSPTTFILRDEVMQEAERSTELLPQANYVAPTRKGGQMEQRGKPGGSGSGGGRPAMDVDKGRSAKDSGRGGGGRRRECWLCGDPDHLCFECPDRSDGEASCSLVSVVEPTISLVPEAGEDFQAVATAVQANPAVVLLDSGCSHHLMGTKSAFVNLQQSGDVKHVRGFNGALQNVQGRGTVALQGEAGKKVLIPDVLYVPDVHANLLSAGQLKESGVQMQDDGDGMLLVSAAGDVLGWEKYTGRILCTDLRPCTPTTTSTTMEMVALRTIATATKSTPAKWHARLAHVGVDTITSSAKHEVATGLDIKPSASTDSPCVSCVGGKLARHTFLDKGSDADDALADVHINLCGPFRVDAKDRSLYFLLLKDHKTRYVWVRPVAKKSDVLREFRTERYGGAGDVNSGGVGADDAAAHGRATLLVAPRPATGRLGAQLSGESTLPPGTTSFQLLTGKKPDLSLARVWSCMAQFLGGHHAGRGVLQDYVIGVWKSEHGPASGRTQVNLPTDTSTASHPLLAKVSEPADEDAEDILSSLSSPAPRAPQLVADLQLWHRCGLREAADERGAAGGEDATDFARVGEEGCGKEAAEGGQPTGTPTKESSATGQLAGESTTGEKSAGTPTLVQHAGGGNESGADAEKQLGGEESTDSDVVEVNAEEPRPQRSGRLRRLPEFLTYHVCLPPAAYTTLNDDADDDLLYDDVEDDIDLPKLDPDMHADHEHRWDIATMTVKEALASWKGKAVKATMDEEIRSLIGMGTAGRTPTRSEHHEEPVYGADYDETYAPVSSYVTLRIFLSIVAVLDMKNVFLQSKLDRVLYMYQPDYYNDGTGRVRKLLKSTYGLKQLPLLWYRALDDVLMGAGWKKIQVDEALYFKVGANEVACRVLVYVDDLLAASSSTVMLNELKELLEVAFELREILPVERYLGLEIVRDRPVRKLWLHQWGYADKLRRRFIDKEQTGRNPKTPVSVDAYEELSFDDEEGQEQ
ncbi:unnamed protein product [Closterium sp. NIES-53]